MFKRSFPLLYPDTGDAPATAAPASSPAAATPSAEATPPAAAPTQPDGSLIAPPTEATPPAFDAAAAKAFLIEKGAKAEDLDKLNETEIESQFKQAQDDAAKATADAEAAKAIEFKLPDGITMDDASAQAFKDVMGDDKLTPSERAQKLVDMHADALKKAATAPHETWQKTQADWQTVVKADPELGGQKFDEVKSTISMVLTEIGGKDAWKMFDAFAFTGAGNNPEIVRAVYRLCVAHTEGRPVGGSAPGISSFAKTLTSMYPSAAKAR